MEPLQDNPHFIALNNRVLAVETELKTNTATTKRVEDNTRNIVEAFVAARGAFKVLEVIGRLTKILLVFGAAVIAIKNLIPEAIMRHLR